MAGPVAGPVAGVLLDGMTAAGHEVTVALTEGLSGLRLTRIAGGAREDWPLDRLRVVDSDTRHMVLTLFQGGEDEQLRHAARLTVWDADLIAWLKSRAPDLHQRDIRAGTFQRVAVWVGAAALALGLILFVFLPLISDRLADGLSREREIAFGDAVAGQVEAMLGSSVAADLTCTAPAGVAALEKLRVAVTGGQGLRYDIRLRFMDHEMVNAFALPGGQVVILRGFLDQAGSAAELAGVLGHEIGHVEARDPTRLAFRAAGSAGILSLIFGDLSGGLVLGLAGNHLLSASYTREAEVLADGFAIGLMGRTGLGTEGLAAFFDRIDGDDGDLPDYLSTHPDSGNRAGRARQADQGATNAALSAAEWRALKAICRD